MNKVRRSWVTAPGEGARFWNDSAQTKQKSAWLSLVAGHSYYYEVLHNTCTGFTNNLPPGTRFAGCAKSRRRSSASDFGRTLPSNYLGSDHGWGSHHLVVGGAVQEQRTYGTFPAPVGGGPDDTSTGRWILTAAVDQFATTMAK